MAQFSLVGTNRQIPQIFNAGDTLQWSGSFTNLNNEFTPDDGYSLTYYIRGEDNLSVTGSADGSGAGWIITIPASKTEDFSGGLYEYIARVKKDSDVFTVEQGKITLKPNIEKSEQGLRVNHVQRMITAIEDALEGRITNDVQQFTVAGRSLVHIPALELKTLRLEYYNELRTLQLGPHRQIHNTKVVFGPRE